jgi:hypothetical protein
LRAAGLAPEVVRLVQENSDVIEFLAKRPEVFERIRNEFGSATEDDLQDPASFDFRAETDVHIFSPSANGKLRAESRRRALRHAESRKATSEDSRRN